MAANAQQKRRDQTLRRRVLRRLLREMPDVYHRWWAEERATYDKERG